MEIRKDFDGVARYLHRLWGIGDTFGQLFREDWSHLRNREDFDNIYRLDASRKAFYENIYCDGRDMAHYMSGHLRDFNLVALFPTLASYVESFDKNWCARTDHWEKHLADMRVRTAEDGTPWAVRQMVELWETQVGLLKAVNETVALLKQSDEYLVEKGYKKVSDVGKHLVNIGVVGNVGSIDRLNVGSTDNSTNVHVTARDVFTGLREAMERAELPAADKGRLAECIDGMEAETGKPGFLQRYQDFMSAAANHMTVFGPYLAPLAQLLKG